MHKPRIAVQLYSVRHELEKDFFGTLKTISELGYEGVEFFGPYIRPDLISKGMSDTGLKVAGWHTPIENLLPGVIESTILYNRTISNYALIVPSLKKEYTASRTGCLEAADILDTASPKLAEYGMYTGYHCHASDFVPFDEQGDTAWDIIAEATKVCIDLQMDTGNCMQGGADPIALMRKYPNRYRTIHVKPYSKEKGFATMIGKDDVDWQTLKEICETEKINWLIVEYEDVDIYTPLEGIRLCLWALKGMGF